MRVTDEQDQVRIEVTDTGPGISPEVLPFIFDRFRQGDNSRDKRKGGLGLGLSIVRELVELHGGTVTATSPGDGLGSTFAVDLPQRKASHASAPDREDSKCEDLAALLVE